MTIVLYIYIIFFMKDLYTYFTKALLSFQLEMSQKHSKNTIPI